MITRQERVMLIAELAEQLAQRCRMPPLSSEIGAISDTELDERTSRLAALVSGLFEQARPGAIVPEK